MSERTRTRGIYYFDVAVTLAGGALAGGHVLLAGVPGAPALRGDVAGLWVPLLAVALLLIFRRRAYTQERPWIAGPVAALALVGICAVFWRLNLMIFIAAMAGGSVMLLAGLILRTRRISERLTRDELFGLTAMVGSLCLGVALSEVVIRLVPTLFGQEIQQMLRADPGNYGVAHPYIGHLHRPNNTFVLSGRDFEAVHRVDALGFRNARPWPDRAEIVTVGDSVTFGQCVDDEHAWPYLLERSVAPRRVVNLGLVGAGPQQYARVYETFGIKLRPKALIVGVFAQNDFWDAGAFDDWLNSGVGGNYMIWRDFGRPQRLHFSAREPVASLEALVRAKLVPVVRRTYLYTLLRALRGGMEGDAPAPPRTVQFADGSRLQLRESDFLSKSALAQPGRREFELLVQALQEIHSLAAGQGTRALVILQPGKEQVYLPLLGRPGADPTSALRPALDRLGIEYLDLAPAFGARAAAGERLYFEDDVHPNEAGQALIAELVLAHLVAHTDRYGQTE